MAQEPNLGIIIGDVQLDNPVMPASGCFGPELQGLIGTADLGAVVTKTLFHDARAGNPAHRVYDLQYGMLNSVGIPSMGTEHFNHELLPRYRQLGTKVIVSIGGLIDGEYFDVIEHLDTDGVDLIEVNISCPNLEHDGLPIATSAERTANLIRQMAASTSIPLIAKLTPMVTDIRPIALAAQNAGAAAVTISNSVPGLAINTSTRRAVLGNVTGGYTGPAIKPIILYLVHEAYTVLDIPILGCGGIHSLDDALEYFFAGASAVQLGTATFTNPHTMNTVIQDLREYCKTQDIKNLKEIIGAVIK